MAVQTVVKTIGSSGRTYTTLVSWEADAPANLTTAEKSAAGTFVGSFVQGESLSFVGSGATGKFLDTDGATYIIYGVVSGDPAASDVVTGAGGSCVLSSSTPTDVGVIWQGQMYNDSDSFTGSSQLTLSGSTSSASCYKELTTGAGQSFQDHASVRSNALTYDRTKGVGISATGPYQACITFDENNARVSKVQIKSTHATQAYAVNLANGTTSGARLQDVIAMSATTVLNTDAPSGMTLINVQMINTGSGGNGFGGTSGSPNTFTFIGCTAIRTANQSAAGIGFRMGNYSGTANIMQSCASFGFSTAITASRWDTTNSKFNATDQASGLEGSSNQHAVTYSSVTPFTQANASGNDCRPIAGTALIDNGFLSGSAGNDISGTARDSTPTIGCWEVVSAAVSFVPAIINAPVRGGG